MTRPALPLGWLFATACLLPRAGAGQAPDPSVATGSACLVEPAMVIDVSTAVEDVLETVEVEKGDRVSEGDVIARLASDVEQAAVEQARARVEARATLRAREVALRYARAKYERAAELRQQKFVSGDELDDLRAEVELAELALAEERERKVLAELDLLRAEALYRTRVVRSPLEGESRARPVDQAPRPARPVRASYRRPIDAIRAPTITNASSNSRLTHRRPAPSR